jgi:hypothetical protein
MANLEYPNALRCSALSMASHKEGKEKIKKSSLCRLRKREWSIRWLEEHDRVSRIDDLLNLMKSAP